MLCQLHHPSLKQGVRQLLLLPVDLMTASSRRLLTPSQQHGRHCVAHDALQDSSSSSSSSICVDLPFAAMLAAASGMRAAPADTQVHSNLLAGRAHKHLSCKA
jgi:hypothetical protein